MVIMHVENAVPENQYIEKYMNILIAQIIKFKLLDITFIIFKYCIGVLIYSYLKVCFWRDGSQLRLGFHLINMKENLLIYCNCFKASKI